MLLTRCGLWLLMHILFVDTDAPIYRTDTKGVEAYGYPGYSNYPPQHQDHQQEQSSQDNSCCTQLLVIGGAALCCFLCMQLCGNKDNQTQTNTFAPLATGCLANLCRENVANTTTNSNRNYNSVDNQIVTAPPDPSAHNYGRSRRAGKDLKYDCDCSGFRLSSQKSF